MLSSLGIYVEKNIIKYAKIKRVRDTYKVDVYNVETYEDLKDSIEKIVLETDSYKVPISINISNELYNYFDVFSVLEKKDITKSLDIEFEMLCSKKGYAKDLLESRYILGDNKEDLDKYKALYISVNRDELEGLIDILDKYRLASIAPVSTSIGNLIAEDDNDNIAIINMENETKITTIINGQISRVDILDIGLEEAVNQINKIEMSYKKSYDKLKSINIYDYDVKSIDETENEYIEFVLPVIEQIADKSKQIIKSFNEAINKVYITGLGATINNIELYFQEYFKNIKCEVLKPFFIDPTSLKTPIKEYIEVNSAIAIALDGIGFINKDLNFAPQSKLDAVDIENIKTVKSEIEDADWNEEMFEKPVSRLDKTLLRVIFTLFALILVFSVFSINIGRNINNKIAMLEEGISNSDNELKKLDQEIYQIESYTNIYETVVNGETSAKTVNVKNQSRKIAKNALPNMLNKLMFVIPQEVQVESIENTKDNHIVIVATSEKYDLLGKFLNSLKDDILKNTEASAITKENSLNRITIEGDI